MCFSQLDPSLMTQVQSRGTLARPLIVTRGANWNPNRLHCEAEDSTTPYAKGDGDLSRGTRANQEAVQQKAKDKRTKSPGRARKTGRSSQISALGSSVPSPSQSTEPGLAPTQSQPSGPDVNPPFNLEDYENVCGYLEEEANYTRLYGDGSKTTVGTTKVTKAAAYDIFVIYINDNSNR
ncbi:hypothetical protein PGTUg99_013671 [Puccinia graminis f. sp. tritici]|uniref:Uncharacterized protein n=1 Tax=Puccinia graminis f. sp. tritici TaxID=56615 RepID=A0A5B0M3W4_PUCGR|nr:hypothetical protein PGTUg99_013671 [Puccinia graminis f. sp. tritici]